MWNENINAAANILIGITAIASFWFSIKTLRKSGWDSAMNTAPSLVLRPQDIWTGIREDPQCMAYASVTPGKVIHNSVQGTVEIAFTVVFECFNAGRGVAFNISQPKSKGIPIAEDRTKVALYQTVTDDPFQIGIQLVRTYNEWCVLAGKAIPVNLEITYTNDQGNVHCNSSWSAKVQPFDKKGDNLEVRELQVMETRGKIQYSDRSFADTHPVKQGCFVIQILYEK